MMIGLVQLHWSQWRCQCQNNGQNIWRVLFVLDNVLRFLINSSTRNNEVTALEFKPLTPMIYSLIWSSCFVFKLLNNMIWKFVRIKACSQTKTVLTVSFLRPPKSLFFWVIDLFYFLFYIFIFMLLFLRGGSLFTLGK